MGQLLWLNMTLRQHGLKDISIPFNWENERDAGLEKLLISFSI